MTDTPAPTPASTMSEILTSFPGAKRALFSAYHIGGCSSCAYGEEETLASVCDRNEIATTDVINTIVDSHQHDLAFLIEPLTLAERLKNENILLLDTRTREEHEAVTLPNSQFLTQDLQQQLFAKPPKETIVLYDHSGHNVLDTCSWFSGHGLKNVFALRGGIDSWSQEVDSSVPRYRLEID